MWRSVPSITTTETFSREIMMRPTKPSGPIQGAALAGAVVSNAYVSRCWNSCASNQTYAQYPRDRIPKVTSRTWTQTNSGFISQRLYPAILRMPHGVFDLLGDIVKLYPGQALRNSCIHDRDGDSHGDATQIIDMWKQGRPWQPDRNQARQRIGSRSEHAHTNQSGTGYDRAQSQTWIQHGVI